MLKFKLTFLLILLSCFSFSQEIEVITQEKIIGNINNIIYSPDGSLIASGTEKESAIKIWDINSGKIIGKLDGHEKNVTAFCFNEDGKKLYSSSQDEMLLLWDIVNWKLIDSVNIGTHFNTLRYQNGTLYGGAANGGCYSFTKGNIQQENRLFTEEFPIVQLDFYADKLAAGTNVGKVTIFNLSSGQELQSKKLHLTGIQGLKFIESGSKIITTGGGGTVHIWNVKDLSDIKFLQAATTPIVSFDANDAKKFFVIASESKEIKVYNFEGKLLFDFKTKEEEYEENLPIDAISISPDGTTVASTGFRRFRSRKKKQNDNVIRIWDVNRGNLMNTLEGTVNPIYAFDFHPNENKLVTLGEDRIVTVWSFDHAEKLAQFELNEPKREKAPPRQSAGKKILNMADKFIRGGNVIGDIKETAKDKTEDAAASALKRAFRDRHIVKFTSDGKYMVTKLPKDEIRLYDLSGDDPEYLRPLWSYQSLINEIVISPDGKFMAVLGAGDSAVSIIDMETHEFVTKLSTPEPVGKMRFAYEANSGAFSPDGEYFAVCFITSKTFVYRTKGWYQQFENELPNNVGYARGCFVNFSEDGNYMVVNSMFGALTYETKGFSTYKSEPLSVKGYSIPMDKPSDYAITIHDDHLYFENIFSHEFKKSIKVDHKQITHVSISKTGKIGMTLTTGQFYLFNPETGLEETQMVAEGDNYIFKTPDNYYKVSRGGYDLVTFRIGNHAYPFEQFDAIYNRPDLVLEKLGCTDTKLLEIYKKAYEKRIKKLGLEPIDKVKLEDIPYSKINNLAEIPAITENSSISIEIEFKDNTSLSAYNVYLNNVPMYGKSGKDLTGKTSFKGTEKIDLVHGINKIQVSCRNKKGLESLMQTFYIEKVGVRPQTNLYLVTIGTSEYQETNYNLNYAVKDAKDLTTVLSSNPNNVYGEVKSRSLYNEEVTVSNILALKEFLNTSKPDDVVLLFVAGHGVLDKNFDYYFGTHNIDFLNPSAQGLAYEQLEGLLDGIKANKKILIMDTCHSGEVDKDEVIEAEVIEEDQGDIEFRAAGLNIAEKEGEGASASRLSRELFNDLRRGTGSTVISSAGGAEFAMESDEWKNGLFTYCLLNGLKNKTADLDNDGIVMLSELQEYVVIKVAGLSHGRQVPNTRMQNIELDFRVW